jgi:uncharacterized repeat protein (TIGR03803 family)
MAQLKQSRRWIKRLLSIRNALPAFLGMNLLLGSAWAQKESVLYSFCAQSGCTDGEYPYAGLVFDKKGNLYGTTYAGGLSGFAGTVFAVTPSGKESVVHSFCAGGPPCNDGASPEAGLIFDTKENLYGTTAAGGTGCSGGGGCGTVFKVRLSGKQSVLYSFQGDPDGAYPDAGLIFDTKGSLYGTTTEGGASSECDSNGCGTVFKVTPSGKESVLYSFCGQSNCTDGANPIGGLIFGTKGDLYGTTYAGGDPGPGTVFKLTPSGKEIVLYTFCLQAACADGEFPFAGLVFDTKGNLYGTARQGGAFKEGVVFRLTPSGKETGLYSFCRQSGCADGAFPDAALVFDKKGNLYGTTVYGGAFKHGTVFKITPSGKESVLYSFCRQSKCTDGADPYGGLIFDKKGNLYGTTSGGGAFAGGTVFKLVP